MKRMHRASVEELYREYGATVLRRARVILGDEQAAMDAMQEVFVKVLRKGAQFRGEASPMTWLYRVTTNYCLNVIRDRSRRRELLMRQRPDSESSEHHGGEERLALATLLRKIPQELREIAVYYYADQMNQDEIAALLGVSRRTVGNRLEEFRATAQAVLVGS